MKPPFNDIERIQIDKNKNESNAELNTIRIKAILNYKGMLQVEQDEHIGECICNLSDDQWEVDFLCPVTEWSWAVRFFYSLGLNAEVTEPEALRQEVFQLAEQMCNQYKQC